MHIDPTALVIWLLIGAIAGWLAGQIMGGGGFGLVGDIIVGIIGAFIYGMDTNPVQTAGHQPTTSATAIASPPSASPPPSPAVREPETTGSGGINRVPPKQDPRENEQSERP